MVNAAGEGKSESHHRAYPPPIDLTQLVNALNPRLLFEAVITRWRAIVISAIIVGLVGTIAVALMPKAYTARAKILIQDSVAVNPFMSEMSVEWEINTRLPIVRDIVQSRGVAVSILTHLGEINETTSDTDVDFAVDDFPGRIKVVGNPGGIIELGFSANSRDQSVKGLQAIMEVLRDEMLGPQKDALDSNVTFLGDQLERVEQEIAVKVEEIRQYRSASSVQSPEVHKVLLEAYGTELGRFNQAQSDLAAAEQRLRLATSRIQAYDPNLRSSQQTLERAESELSRLEATFTADHPDVRAARSRAESARAALDGARANPQGIDINTLERLLRSGNNAMSEVLQREFEAYRAANAEVESLQQMTETLQARLTDAEATVKQFADAQATLTQLETDLESLRKVQANLFERRQDSIVTRELTLADERRQVWVIEEPRPPRKSDSLSLKLGVIASVMAGVILGLVITAIAELLDRTVRLPREATEAAGVPVIAVLPYLEA
jgi:uncharacterized protein involved in exopolysaccharide biosynthesis